MTGKSVHSAGTSPTPSPKLVTLVTLVTLAASASSEVTVTISAPVPSTMPFTVATAIRTPVNDPGPIPSAQRLTSPGLHPTSPKSRSIIGSSDSPCALETRCATSATSRSPSKSATDPSAVAVSTAQIFIPDLSLVVLAPWQPSSRLAQSCAKRPERNAASSSWSTRCTSSGARGSGEAPSAALISLSALSWLNSCTSDRPPPPVST